MCISYLVSLVSVVFLAGMILSAVLLPNFWLVLLAVSVFVRIPQNTFPRSNANRNEKNLFGKVTNAAKSPYRHRQSLDPIRA